MNETKRNKEQQSSVAAPGYSKRAIISTLTLRIQPRFFTIHSSLLVKSESLRIAAMTPVRVSIPASVAGNIKSLKKSMAEILGKLGCPACCSGHDIYLELQRSVVIQKGLKDEIKATPALRSPIQMGTHRAVSVGIKPDQVDTLDEVFAAIDRIAEISGHSACATGCDLFFGMERNFVINPQLEVVEQVLVMR